MKLNKDEQIGVLKVAHAVRAPYAVFLLMAAVALLVFAVYLGSDALEKWGAIAFWLSVAGRCFSWLMDYAERIRK